MTTMRKIIDIALVLIIASTTFGTIYLYYSDYFDFLKEPVYDTVIMPPIIFQQSLKEKWNLQDPEILPADLTFHSTHYKNTRLGIGFTIPKEAMNYGGQCTQSGSQAVVHSANTPLGVTESGNTLYIGHTYTYTTDGVICSKIDSIFSTINAGWSIVYFNAGNYDEVQSWIINTIGPNCRITSTKPWLQNTALESYEFNRDYETCPYNPYQLLRNPKNSRGYLITFGPEPVFWRNAEATLHYDYDVLNSFYFF